MINPNNTIESVALVTLYIHMYAIPDIVKKKVQI